jgi:Carboxypeptidase regulatory-like domain
MSRTTRKSPGDRGLLYLRSCASRQRRARLHRMAWSCALALTLATLGLTAGAPSLLARKTKPPTTKTIRGQVLDAQDNGIVGATVEMTNLKTGAKTAIYTGDGGHFVFTGIKTYDDYQFRATYKAQASEIRKVSSWDTRMQMVLNLHIPPPKE